MKLLHIITNLERGGAQKVLYDLICGLDKKEYEHHIIYFRHGPYVEKFKKLGIPIYGVRGLFTLYDPFFFFNLYRLIKKIDPNAIHSLLWAANVFSRVVAWLLKIPIATVYHNNVFQDGVLRVFLDTTMQTFFGSTVVAVSDEIKNGLQQRNKKNVPAVEIIANGIDIYNVMQRAKKENNVYEQRINDAGLGEWLKNIMYQFKFSQNNCFKQNSNFIIGSVGRFVPIKNYPLLIESFSIVLQTCNKVRLVLVGSGVEEQKLRMLVMEKGIADKVTFVVGQSAYGYYPFFDCFVQSSDKEGISIALLEAMSLAITSIVTDKDNKHMVIENKKNGLLVEAGNAQRLAQALLKIIQNENLKRKYGLAGQQTVLKNFSSQRMIKNYHTLFKKLTESIY